MTTTVKIIAEWDAKQEAYNRGYSRFQHGDPVEPEEFHFSHYTGSAEWANTVAPSLRAMAGYDDTGHGTYQEEPYAIVLVEVPEDEPAEGEFLRKPWHFLDELVECFQSGAFDAATGADRDPPLPPAMSAENG
jgi:hypothetical protein